MESFSAHKSRLPTTGSSKFGDHIEFHEMLGVIRRWIGNPLPTCQVFSSHDHPSKRRWLYRPRDIFEPTRWECRGSVVSPSKFNFLPISDRKSMLRSTHLTFWRQLAMRIIETGFPHNPAENQLCRRLRSKVIKKSRIPGRLVHPVFTQVAGTVRSPPIWTSYVSSFESYQLWDYMNDITAVSLITCIFILHCKSP